MDRPLYYDKTRNVYWRQVNKTIPPISLIKEININIMSFIDDKQLHVYSRVNQYIRSLYNDKELWIKKIQQKHHNFPVLSVLNSTKLQSLLIYEGGLKVKLPVDIKGLYIFIKDKDMYRLNQIAPAIHFTEISKWLLYEYNIKPRCGPEHLFRAITRNQLNYLKFYNEECGYDINFQHWEEFTCPHKLALIDYIKAMIPQYKYNRDVIEYLLQYNSTDNEIVLSFTNHM